MDYFTVLVALLVVVILMLGTGIYFITEGYFLKDVVVGFLLFVIGIGILILDVALICSIGQI